MTGLASSFHSSSLYARKVITLTILFCLLGVAAQAQLKFNKSDFDTGKGPVSVAAADFNRDGFLDVVTANSRNNCITVLINNGNSTFDRRTDYPAGKKPFAVVTADFNHDGFADVAVVNQDDNSVSIFLGNGDGTLRPSITFAVGKSPDVMLTADFNKDGKPDLAVVNNAANTFSIYLGNGEGTFTHSADYSAGPGDPSFLNRDGIAAADFNGDGILDLAVANGRSDNVSIFLGKPDGTFIAAGNFTLFGGASGVVDSRIVTADFNQDGQADLVVQFVDCRQRGCTDGSMIFAGHGDGTFGSETSFPFNGIEAIIAADVNGDHVPDVIGPDGLVLVNPATAFSTGSTAMSMPAAGLGPLALVAARKDVLYPVLYRLGLPRPARSSGFHRFRHSAGSYVNAQTGTELAHKLLGHSRFETTANVYTHALEQQEREAAMPSSKQFLENLFLNLFPNACNRL